MTQVIPRRMRRAMLACASFLFVGRAALAQAVPDTLPPVLLIHGFNSNAGTWALMDPALHSSGFGRVFRTSTSFEQNITYQAGELSAFSQASGIFAESPLLVAHSMGGLVARQLSKSMPSDAIITIGSPHGGQLLLDNVFSSPVFYGMIGTVSIAAGDVIYNLWRCGSFRQGSYGEPVAGPCYTIWEWIDFSSVALFALYGAYTFMTGGSTDDMTPESGFLSTLNSSGQVALENASMRIAMLGQLNPWESNLSLFRLNFDAGSSAAIGALLPWMTASVVSDGFLILNDVDTESPWFWEETLGALGLISGGFAIMGLPSWYNSLIGSWPNDGFMAVSTQTYPGATNLDAVGYSHGEETSSEALRSRVVEIGAVFKRN